MYNNTITDQPIIGLRIKSKRLYIRYPFTKYLPTAHFVTPFLTGNPVNVGVYQTAMSSSASSKRKFLYWDGVSWFKLIYTSYSHMEISHKVDSPTFYKGLKNQASKFVLTHKNIPPLEID